MKIALDLFPILLFFAAYKFGTIYEATAVLMAATLVQSLLMYRLEGKLATMQKVTLALIVTVAWPWVCFFLSSSSRKIS
jgi:intracellular septation protein